MPGHRKRRQFKQTDAFTRGMVMGLKRAGWSIRQIAADTHLGASTVHRLWRRWLEQGNVEIYRNVGATRVTSARVDRRILRQAVAAPQATCTAILQHVQDTLDHSISTRNHFPSQRLEWCRARSTWMTEWHRSCSQMSRVSACPVIVAVYACGVDVEKGPIRQQLWNAPPCDNVESWFGGAIAYDSRSPLLRIQGTMTAQRYVDDVLRPVTLPYLQGYPMPFISRITPRPHTARISQQALQDVQMLPWPPYSPDLSPIEHVWDIIGRRLHALPQPRSEDELWQMVGGEWRAIPQDAIRTLIDSLPRRVAACIAVRDGSKIDSGAAIIFPSQEHQPVLLRLHPDCTAFQAELLAILWAAQIAESSPTKTAVTIASDCRSALAAICSTGPTRTSLVTNIMKSLTELLTSGCVGPFDQIPQEKCFHYQISATERPPPLRHGHVLADITRVLPETDSTCIHCSEEPQTVNHLLFNCPAFLKHRMQTAILLELTHLNPRSMARLNLSMELPGQLVQLSNQNRTRVKALSTNPY
ncbi:hypothetical protein LAZ67_2001132 [Cordylochernes scorpioides]|uniref:RNase H type-1 domain-containing protein n=1 Tax=Cordylochernes scorpioides TaxID=51811 RepID=A0ABY6K2P3_9ARAC|nr:hypothetical protein LAZ67_2001132 [Cordylochernes scorpioides]